MPRQRLSFSRAVNLSATSHFWEAKFIELIPNNKFQHNTAIQFTASVSILVVNMAQKSSVGLSKIGNMDSPVTLMEAEVSASP